MNKHIAAGALALGLVLTAQQEASAWTKFSFNAGVSINYEGGNNNVLWGMFKGGQVPGYPTDVNNGAVFFGNSGPAPYAGGFGYGAYPDYAGAAPVAPAMPTAEPPMHPVKTTTQAVYYPNQPAAYYPATSYQAPAYNYSYGSGYGYAQQVPSYWYGR